MITWPGLLGAMLVAVGFYALLLAYIWPVDRNGKRIPAKEWAEQLKQRPEPDTNHKKMVIAAIALAVASLAVALSRHDE